MSEGPANWGRPRSGDTIGNSTKLWLRATGTRQASWRRGCADRARQRRVAEQMAG